MGDQIQIIYNELKNQILLAFDYCENCKDSCKEEEARDKTLAFLKTIPQIREYLATDAQATFDGDPAAISISEIVLFELVTRYFAMSIFFRRTYSRSVFPVSTRTRSLR